MKAKLFIVLLLVIDVILSLSIITHGMTFRVLNPSGVIAKSERNILLLAASIVLSIIIPVFILTFFIVVRYQEGNAKTPYTPDWNYNRKLEVLWWIIPAVIIVLLGTLTWITTHQLDPTKSINAPNKPLTIEVVALQWRWLFIYPQQHIATINFVEFPVNTPVAFQLTADGPMTSFWIPQLGGQMYAMSAMVNTTHLISNAPGEFQGINNEISGQGFIGMRFIAKSTTQADFDRWVQIVQQSSQLLNLQKYTSLAQPNTDEREEFYSLSDKDLYNEIVTKFMIPPSPAPLKAPYHVTY